MNISDIDLKSYSSRFSSYTELRLHENRTVQIGLLKGDAVANSRNTTGGVSARVFDQGTWGFASHPELSGKAIETAISSATKNAAFLAQRCGNPGAVLPRTEGTANSDFRTKKQRMSQEKLVQFLRQIDNYIVENCPDIISRHIGLNCLDMEKKLHTSEGSYGHNITTRSIIMFQLSTRNAKGEPIELSCPIGSRGQFEDVFPSPEKVYPKVDALYAHLMNKKDAVKPIAGLHDVILDADLSGILAHEAIGHTTEADIVRAGSVAGDYMGQTVASELITLVDYAHTYKDETVPVPVYLDDEGVLCEDAIIIENGVLKSFMHSKDSAAYFDAKPTGNARAFSYSDEPLIRMRNTAILPGNDKLEDMIASIDNGYYLMRATNGQADTTSEFMFGIQLGYEIKAGKLGRAITDTTISGIAFDVLKNVTMVSDDMSWNCAGMCGKKQMIPVGLGGPAIKTKIYIGGE